MESLGVDNVMFVSARVVELEKDGEQGGGCTAIINY